VKSVGGEGPQGERERAGGGKRKEKKKKKKKEKKRKKKRGLADLVAYSEQKTKKKLGMARWGGKEKEKDVARWLLLHLYSCGEEERKKMESKKCAIELSGSGGVGLPPLVEDVASEADGNKSNAKDHATNEVATTAGDVLASAAVRAVLAGSALSTRSLAAVKRATIALTAGFLRAGDRASTGREAGTREAGQVVALVIDSAIAAALLTLALKALAHSGAFF